MSKTNKKALVTLAIGKKYERMYERYCQNSWRKYCNNHSYDLIVITKPLDDSPRGQERSPSWQKLLILSQDWSSKYEQVVWVDTDVMINAELAPDIAEIVPVEKVGAVEAYSIPSREIYKIALQRAYDNWRSQGVKYIDNSTPSLYYQNRGIPSSDLDKVVHGGVFVCSPKEHREIFEFIYYNYEDKYKTPEWNYEMPALSYELLKNNMVTWLPPQFNFCVWELISAFYPFIFHANLLEKVIDRIRQNLGLRALDPKFSLKCQCLKNIYDLGYFIHFAGCARLMEYLHQYLQRIK